MEMVEMLTNFLKLVSGSKVFRQSHLSLFTAILLSHSHTAPKNPFRVSRRELMKNSAIRSYATYHKCMVDLIENGVLEYEPSYHPKLASRIRLLDFAKKL